MIFWKMNGAGNDFIILDRRSAPLPEAVYSDLARRLCERHLSIGADGLMVVLPAQHGGDYAMRFYNSDGSLGEMCGNGARCICRFGYENGLAGELQHVETTAGPVVGYRLSQSEYRIRLNDPSVIDLDRSVEAEEKVYPLTYVELGSPGIPHAVVAFPGLRAANNSDLFRLGKELREHPAFPKGANVNFYEILEKDHVYIRTYERGVEDFTYACGTGTGSTALALALQGVTGTHVTAQMRGGILTVDIDFENGAVKNLWLTGPTNIVAKGEITDENIKSDL